MCCGKLTAKLKLIFLVEKPFIQPARESRKKKTDVIPQGENENTFSKAIESVWFSGVCKKWKQTFGFVEGIIVTIVVVINVLSLTVIEMYNLIVLDISKIPEARERSDISRECVNENFNDPVKLSKAIDSRKIASGLIGRDIFVHASHLPKGVNRLEAGIKLELQVMLLQ